MFSPQNLNFQEQCHIAKQLQYFFGLPIFLKLISFLKLLSPQIFWSMNSLNLLLQEQSKNILKLPSNLQD
jgi:hypothetical protein